MSGSVTPARRSRDESDDEEDFEVSIDGESPARLNRSKRARLDIEDEEEQEEVTYDEDVDEQDGDEEAPVLPDSFRRSPKGKGRANGRATTSDGPKKHQPGSIVRVTLTDFVTYTSAEFKPGPNLNMVIGPNGTGKSTLVCAICIGLGWHTKHLGRGKDLDEFVKHGARSGKIEIELAADPVRHDSNPVITTKIKKGNTQNAEYWINGLKENKKRVAELCASFSIQVDNLCQFLPQDKVVEFAGMSPVELLASTQRAAAPQHMSEWHEQLKDYRKEQKKQQIEQQELAESIKKMEDRQRTVLPDVERYQERKDLLTREAALKKMRVLPEYRDAKNKWQQSKQRSKEAQKELQALERRMEPNLAAVAQKEQYVGDVQGALLKQQKLVERVSKQVSDAKKKIDGAADKIQECKDQRDAERNSTTAVRKSMPQLLREVTGCKNSMTTPPPAYDPAAMNERVREKTRQMREIDTSMEAASQEVGSLGHQISQRKTIIENAQREKDHLQSQAGQQINKLQSFSPDAAKALKWIDANRNRFQGEVFGPPLVECNVKDERHASAVESVVQSGDALAFTVTTKADFDMLTGQLNHMKIRQVSVRASLKRLETYQPSVSNDALQQYGLQGWILDLLEGPEPVLAMLCDNRNIHQSAYTFRDITPNQFAALQQSPISSWVTAKQSHNITRRREYGDKATSTKVTDLRPARMFTKVSIDHHQESEVDRRIAETRSEISELEESRRAKMEEVAPLKKQKAELKEEKDAIEREKNNLQSQHSHFNALPLKLERAEGKLITARKQIASSAARLATISERQDTLCLEKGQYALDYANVVEQLRVNFVRMFEAEIVGIEANSDVEQAKAQHEDEQRLIDERKREVGHLKARTKELLAIGQAAHDKCTEMQATLEEWERDLLREIEDWDLDQYATELASLGARIEGLIGGGDQRTIDLYEERAAEIERKSHRFHELATASDVLAATIADVREKWEPELDELVAEISEAFADNFAKIQCAGEVGVYKDEEDFEQWAIQIKVKFREHEPLSLLDSHRQSGGERAVSTIFYLMALQSLARAPFRVVDEINQGMDPRNERLVHSRMVDIACAEASEGRQGSQYFLITPKLLQGLKYHPDMKVHCIASGEHMPNDFREIDFANAAKRALQLKGRRAGVAAG